MYVKGVGPARAAMLDAKGLHTVEDLLAYAPFRYEDRTNVKPIAQLAPGETATVIARVHAARSTQIGRRRTGIFEATFVDSSGGRMVGKWFHGDYLASLLVPGLTVALYGKIEIDSYTGHLGILHPEYEILPEDDEDSEAALHTGRVVPIYEAAGRVTTRVFRLLLHHVLETLRPQPDALPARIRERLRLPDYWESVRGLHFPAAGADLRTLNAFRSPAHHRLIFEEFFWLECGLALKRAKARAEQGIAFELNDRVREKVKAMLPFKPTAAQKRVLGEIARDMAAPRPMQRLLQGDVGSGKTLVAAEAAIIAIENGCQSVLLAPTEILATQHYLYFRGLFEKLGYLVVLLTGSNTKKEKETIKRLIASGAVHMVAGTHALLEGDVEFHRVGLVIIDEQHRFGVMQRLRMQRKGVTPDVLVMTATPIPRTLALTLYGDLDTSVIDEMPPGRKPVITHHVPEERVEQAWSMVEQQVGEGRQAYVVYPVIEESETTALKAARMMHEQLSTLRFPKLRTGLLHGRMKADEKEAVMAGFKKGDIHILVSTTVIEVGVDVPNSSVMVIEQAERFGLSQLHQLRGRVGRGASQSYCILVTGRMNEAAQERIRTMVDSTDGFHIAEMDLRLRGPGEFFGTKQSGMPALRIASIIRDRDILELARSEASQFVEHPPEEEEARAAVAYLRNHWQRRYGLAQVG